MDDAGLLFVFNKQFPAVKKGWLEIAQMTSHIFFGVAQKARKWFCHALEAYIWAAK